MIITIDGININYESVGEGKDILLLHGWGCSLETLSVITAHFSDAFKVTSFDFPGFGKSDMLKEPWDVQKYADITLKLIKKLELNNPIIMGHSHGGRVAIKLVGENKVKASKMVLIDSAGLKPKTTINKRTRLYLFKIIKWFLTRPLIKNKTESMLNKVRRHYGSVDYNNAPEVLRNTLVKLINEDLSYLLKNINTSTLLIWGENDTATPLYDGQKMEKLIKDSGLCVIKGAGHFSFIEKPYEVLTILDSFLRGR